MYFDLYFFYYNGIAYRIINNLLLVDIFDSRANLDAASLVKWNSHHVNTKQICYGPGLNTHLTLVTCSVKMVDELKEATAPSTEYGELSHFLTKDSVSILFAVPKDYHPHLELPSCLWKVDWNHQFSVGYCAGEYKMWKKENKIVIKVGKQTV